ncbi:hypothetical protein HN385_06275 [archaeon]|jgi:hypothetical protein|nr:hypothetical protein [archaeon]
MSQKSITLENNKHKNYEILSLLTYFYNDKYVLKNLYSGYTETTFQFVKINKEQRLVQHDEFASEQYSIKVDVYDSNDNFYYNSDNAVLKTCLRFTYDQKDIYLLYQYNSNMDLHTASVNYGRPNYYNVIEEGSDKFIKAQNRMINRFTFFELYADKILPNIRIKNDFNTLYRFKKYIKNIIDYDSTKGYDTLRSMCRFVEDDMKLNKSYVMNKFLTIRKPNRESISLSIANLVHKTISISLPDFNSFFNIFIPVFDQLGGVKELENIVLRQRLMEE